MGSEVGAKKMRKIFTLGMFVIVAFALASSGASAQKGATEFDVQNYKIDAELVPSAQLLKARAEVRFVPNADTRSVVFEMNGSLTISRITRADLAPAATTATAVPVANRGQNLKAAPQKSKDATAAAASAHTAVSA